jgi:putative hydrolase of the HAD superfamily
VVINLDLDRVFLEIAGFMGVEPFELKHAYVDHPFLKEYELGKIDTPAFRKEFRKMLRADLEDKHLDELWNSMLRDIPDERIKWITDLKKRYQVVLLSNTNELHIIETNDKLSGKTPSSLEELFDRVYYSFKMHRRKPDRETFDYVLNDLNILPEQSILFDDAPENIDTAAALGMKYVHVPHNELTFSMLPDGK